jgi:YceI-like domain
LRRIAIPRESRGGWTESVVLISEGEGHTNTKLLKPLLVVLLLVLAHPVHADSQWVLKQSVLTYHVSHPLHHVEGVSRQARGKGVCTAGECEFLIAVPVKSFDSGDSNRDLHMLQAIHGAQYPMVIVRTRLPESALKSGTVEADLEIQFAGQTAHLKNVPFHLTTQGNRTRLTGTLPTTLTDFKIAPPSLLLMPIKNEIPVQVDMIWQSEK